MKNPFPSSVNQHIFLYHKYTAIQRTMIFVINKQYKLEGDHKIFGLGDHHRYAELTITPFFPKPFLYVWSHLNNQELITIDEMTSDEKWLVYRYAIALKISKSDPFLQEWWNDVTTGVPIENPFHYVASKELLIRCANISSFAPRKAEIVDRSLTDKRVKRYLDGIVHPAARDLASVFLANIRYVPFMEMYRDLVISLQRCTSELGNTPFTLHLPSGKYGSEWWLVQLLFQSEFKGKEPSVSDKLLTKDIMIVDDCSYTGINALSMIDNALDETDTHHIFHLVIPYMSTEAHRVLGAINKKLPRATVRFYHTEPLIPTVFDVLLPELKKVVVGEDGYIIQDIADTLNIEVDTSATLIYFDHKIAGRMSTMTAVLEAVVYPLPSRAPIERAEQTYMTLSK